MDDIKVLAIDLAKRVFQLHGVNSKGKVLLRKKVAREHLKAQILNMPPCLIAMEACSGAHYWAREFEKMGHTVRLIAPQFVKAFVKSNKNDANDAEAICEAVQRPSMRFVSVKPERNQDIQVLVKARNQLIQSRTAIINELHAIFHEYGIVLPRKMESFRGSIFEYLSPECGDLSELLKRTVSTLMKELDHLCERTKEFDKEIYQFTTKNETTKRLLSIPGVGHVVAAAMFAYITDPHRFNSGRDLSAWVGLVPRQNSSGGRSILKGISKRGDAYLRSLIIHGARASLIRPTGWGEETAKWIGELKIRRGMNRSVVALANKIVRVAWAIMTTERVFQCA